MFRVLVIDDNPDTRELVQRILEDAGYAVDLAADGALGLVLQRARPADVVIAGIFTPHQDGLETVAQLRSEFPQAKVIAMSGGGVRIEGRGHLSTAGEIGAHALLTHPFQPDQLLRAVHEVLQ